MKENKRLRHFLIQKLRRSSYQWPERKAAIKAARVSRGKYKCAKCEQIFGPKEIQLDHIEPVIDPHVGFVDWNTYIDRLFCTQDGFQVLCLQDHEVKTRIENEVRSLATQEKTIKKTKKKKKSKK